MMRFDSFSLTAFITLLGGTGLFLYGMLSASDALRRVAGDRLRMRLARLASKPATGLLAGAIATATLQSSTAVTVMLVAFAGAGLITLAQAAGMILGADVGTTLTVHLIAFRFAEYSLVLVFLGVVLMLSSKSERAKDAWRALAGVGLLFFGMEVMGGATSPLSSSGAVVSFFGGLADRPLLGVVAAAVVAAAVHSSAATIGIAIVLAASGIVRLEAALPIILGANVGTAATALVASVGGRTEARRVAWAHAMFKIAGTIVALPLLGPFASLVAAIGGSVPRQIAIAHTLFNVAVAAMVLPVVGPWTRLVSLFIRPGARDESEFSAVHLDPAALSNPGDAVGRAVRETMRMADETVNIVRRSMDVFRHNDRALLAELRAADDRVDCLDEAVSDYLSRLPEGADQAIAHRQYQVIVTVKELEQIADEVVKQLLGFAERKINVGYYFSDEGYDEIKRLHAEVAAVTEAAVNAFASGDEAQGRRVVQRVKDLIVQGRSLRRAHFARLSLDIPETRATSTLHLDILSTLNHIAIHAGNIGYAVQGKL